MTKPFLTKFPSAPTFSISAAQQRMELEQKHDICISKEQGRLKGHRGGHPAVTLRAGRVLVPVLMCIWGGGQPSGPHSGVSRSAVSSSLLRPMLPSLTCTLETPVKLQKLMLWVPGPGCSGVGPGHLGF